MMLAEFPIFVSYAQVTVFAHSVQHPFNQWSDKHVAQGFSWRPESAAFRTIAEDGQHLITVAMDIAGEDNDLTASRVIDVPFEVTGDTAIEIGSISDTALVRIPSGMYRLRFECYEPVDDQLAKIRLLFYSDVHPIFSIVRADPELRPEKELLLVSSAAL